MTQQHEAFVGVGLTDRFDPEVQAMLLAMYSRNYGPILSRLPTTPEEEASLKERLEKFYVGYGHKSVGQLSSTTIFLEGVSQLAAKAIEDHPLFNGQESSTRYIDFSEQPMVNFGNAVIEEWQEKWRELYVHALPLVTAKLEAQFPQGEDEDETKWRNTIRARTFDICRSLLPAGVTTNVGFYGTFDLINDHFGQMLHHPSSEMRTLAQHAIDGLADVYSHATPGAAVLSGRNEHVDTEYFYTKLPGAYHLHGSTLMQLGHKLDVEAFARIAKRKPYTLLPKSMDVKYRYRLHGLIDFGSFRDLQRHRNGDCLMPLLTPNYGFDAWYLEQLPNEIALIANHYLAEMIEEAKSAEAVTYQYAIPMGCQVGVFYECNLNQLLYLFELRSQKTVHQTLRRYIHRAYDDFLMCNPHGPIGNKVVPGIHIDRGRDNWTTKRGEQTFKGEFK